MNNITLSQNHVILWSIMIEEYIIKIWESPVASMGLIEMIVAIRSVFIGDHFLWFALETHALVAPTACYSVTSVSPYYRHFTSFVWTSSYPVLLHILLEQSITSKSRLFASQSLMRFFLAQGTINSFANITSEISQFQ